MKEKMILKGILWRVCLLLFFSFYHSAIYGENFTRKEILKEESHTYSLSEILKEKPSFQPYKPGQFIREKKSYWLRFLYNKKDPQKISYLLAPYILYQKLDLYYKIRDSIYHYQSGVSLDFEKRNLYLPSLYLQLPNSIDPIECWLHVESFYSYSFFFAEKDNNELISNELKESTREYFLIGLSFLAGIISLIFYLFLKNKLYLYYGIFSFMLLISRLTFSGHIFNYISSFIDFTTLKSIYNLYAISYGGINLAILFYFHELLKTDKLFRKYNTVIYSLATIRFVFLLIHINVENPSLERWVDSRILDLFIQFFLLTCILMTYKKDNKHGFLATTSILILIIANLLFIIPAWGIIKLENVETYSLFLNLAGIEVILFAMLMAYRNYSLKKQHEEAVSKMVENLQASKLLKDQLNKELEIKVEERTEQIRKMNELLKSHNIKLETEVNIANEARVFQKAMNYKDFQKIFSTDQACYEYLAKLKWKSKDTAKCKKCGYEGYTTLENLSRRCGRCRYIESVTKGTLFHGLRFPILKAFYITYRTSIGTKDEATLTEMAEEIDLRLATLWAFRQKVISLMEANTTKKKHKDGWTHLIEYSITKTTTEK